MFKQNNKVSVLDDWPQSAAGAPDPKIFADDSNFVLRYETQNDKFAVVSFPMVNQFIFGSPNDEALNGHPLYEQGLKFYSVHEVANSTWLDELEKQNSTHPQHNKKRFLQDMKHYIFTFHDSTLELAVTEGEHWKPVVTIVDTEQEAKTLFDQAQSTES